MRPILTPEEMAAFDSAAPVPVSELIERAGWAVANAARTMLGGTYGRRVAVIAGKGNNGADGRVAARILEQWGAKCELIEATQLPPEVTGFDLVIDAAYGTGLRRPFNAPDVAESPVLAVDIPSGVDGLTGAVSGHPLCATRTLTFVAPKPGLLLSPGSGYVGELEIVDLGLDTPSSSCSLVEASDLGTLWPRRPTDAHKWRSAVWIIGGGPGMDGAPTLAAEGASRAGAGMVLLSNPSHLGGHTGSSHHIVRRDLAGRWGEAINAEAHRLGAVVMGPGLTDASSPGPVRDEVMSVLASWSGPLVVDASGLDVVAAHPAVLDGRDQPAILTPHDAEFERLGGRLGDRSIDRLASTRSLAAALDAVVLLKGPTTIVADPGGSAWVITSADARLATAGSGDVLAGIIGAALAQGLSPGLAAALGADLHGRAASRGPRVGLTSTDLAPLVARHLSSLAER